MTIIMEEHPTAASILSRKEAGADPVAPTTHYNEEIAENESVNSDEEEENNHPTDPEE